MSISYQSGARELERWVWLKYRVLKQQNTFYLGLNAAENTHLVRISRMRSSACCVSCNRLLYCYYSSQYLYHRFSVRITFRVQIPRQCRILSRPSNSRLFLSMQHRASLVLRCTINRTNKPNFLFQCFISKMVNLGCPIAPLLGKINTYAHWVFCWKFNFIQFLFEAFFNTINNFGSLQPQKEPIF